MRRKLLEETKPLLLLKSYLRQLREGRNQRTDTINGLLRKMKECKECTKSKGNIVQRRILIISILKYLKIIKRFGNQVKPLFSDKKTTLQSNIVIIEDGIGYTENNEVAEKLNNLFVEAVDNLAIEPFTTVNEDDISSENISEIDKNYELHPSIIKIKENVEIKEKFKFRYVTPEDIKDEIDKLNPKKACTGNGI